MRPTLPDALVGRESLGGAVPDDPGPGRLGQCSRAWRMVGVGVRHHNGPDGPQRSGGGQNGGGVGGIGGAGYNFTLGTLPAGTTTYAGYLSNHLAAYSVDLVITGPAKPPELHVNLAGTNLVITGTSPLAGVKYYVLGSTNFQRPRPDWTILATNYFNLAGNLAFTNPISPASPQQFYQLQIP